jgi:hypothetical protein
MKRQLRLVCAGVFILILGLNVAACAAAPTPARIPTNTPPATLTAAPTSAPTNTLPPKPTNTTAPTSPPATTALTKAPATATMAVATAAPKPTSAPTATTAAATKPTSAPTATTAATTTGQSGTNASSAVAVSKDMCLACHGPYDKLATATANYVAPSGEKGSPHRFVPHDATAAVNVPECSNCHQPHPIPPTANMKVTPANVDWCFSTCHHQNDFTPCKNCHNQ